MRIFRLIRTYALCCAILILLGAFVSPDQGKVAVIVSAGDLAQLEDSMKNLERQAIKTYESLGYKVILLGGVDKKGANLSPQVLKQTLGELAGVRDLRFDFIGHGALVPVESNKFSGSGIAVSADRRKNGNEILGTDQRKLVWYAANSSTADQLYYGHKAKLFGFTNEKLQPISHEVVKDALTQFRSKNPDALTTMNLLNCFSGAMAQEFRNTPNTVVFGNSPHNEVALDLGQYVNPGSIFGGSREGFVRATNGLSLYYDSIGASGLKELSLMDARFWANNEMRRALKDDATSLYWSGRSPLFESIIGWCELGKPNRRQAPRTEEEKQKTTEADAKAAFIVNSEISLLRNAFNYAMALPSYSDPQKLRIDEMKKEYESCLNPSPESASYREVQKKGNLENYNNRKKLRDHYQSSPNKPLELLLARYDRVLNDPKNYDKIFENIQRSLANDLSNLTRQKLPQERWGAIKKLIDGIKDGTIGKDKIISDIKNAVSRTKKDCSRVHLEASPCREHRIESIEIGAYLVGDLSSSPSENKCPQNSRYFECLAAGEPIFRMIYEVEKYWHDLRLPDDKSTEEICRSEPWLQLQKTKANLEADEACVKEFFDYAPSEEWANLRRIYELGQRDAKGRPKTPESKPTQYPAQKSEGVQ